MAVKTHYFSTALLTDFKRGNRYSFPCPAKLNLFLYINGRRPDGYHELQTLFQFLNYGDWLHIIPRTDHSIVLTPEIPALKTADNLVYRAAKLLRQTTGCTWGAEIHLDKVLPIGGGVGGGSSDAATALVALNYLWRTGLNTRQLAELGLSLGADVPIFVHGRAAFAEGVGEQISYCEPAEKWYLVIKPKVSVSTGKLFAAPDLTRDTPKKPLTQLLRQEYANDCEKVVRKQYPEVEELLSRLLQYAPARLTGTGACVFAEFTDQASARQVLNLMPNDYAGFVAKGQNTSPLRQMMERL